MPPVGNVGFITDAKNNIATVAPIGNLQVGETFPIVMASYHMSISAGSGGTQLPNVPCQKVEIQNLSGNHVMWWGGVDQHAPFSGRGNELPPMDNGQHVPNPMGEKIIYIANTNQISVCSSFSGEMLSFIAYGNGTNTSIDPSTQGSQPDTTPPSLVSTTPASGSTNIPVNQEVIWTFSEALDPTTTNTSGFYVVTSGQTSPTTLGHLGGTISYTPNSTSVSFTPNSGQFIINDFYVPFVDPSVDDLNGNPISGTSTVSGGSFQIQDAPSVTFAPVSGSINQAFNQAVVATFSETMDSTTVTTSGLYIVISGQATPTTTGHRSGTVVYSSGQTSATINVNSGQYALSAWYVPMAAASLKDPFGVPLASITSGAPFQIIGAPIVSGWFPASGSTGLSGLVVVQATFSQDMLGSTINTSGMFLVVSGQTTPLTTGHMSGSISLSNQNIGQIAPNSGQLSVTTWYTPFVTVNAKDSFGNAVTATISGAPFQTAASFPGDTTPPKVNSVTPVSGTTDVNTSGVQNLVFSKAMLSGTIVNASFVLRDTSSPANVSMQTVSLQSDLVTVSMTPSAGLTVGHGFAFNISGATDLNSNIMTAFSGSSFKTELALVVSGTTPVSGATNVDIGTTVPITVSKAYQSGTVTTTTVRLRDIQGADTAVAGSINMQDTQTIIFNPTSFLALSHLHRVEASGIKDLDGNFMTPHSGATFTTQAAVGLQAVSPPAAATSVAINTNISGLFSRAVNSIDTSTFKIVDGSGNVQAGVVSLQSDNIHFTFNPTSDLAYSSVYTYEISGVQDLAIESFMTPFSGFSFTTVAPALTQFYSVGSSSSNVDMATYIRFGEGAATSNSDLKGRVIRQVQPILQRQGSPTGTLFVRIRDNTDAIKVDIGSIPVASLSTSWTAVTFTNLNNVYAIATSGWVSYEYSGANGSNTIALMKNGSNLYDGSNSIAFQRSPGFGTQGSTDVAGKMWV